MPGKPLPEWEKGSLDGIETGVRQLIRSKPLDTMYQDWNRVRDICAHIAVGVIHPML